MEGSWGRALPADFYRGKRLQVWRDTLPFRQINIEVLFINAPSGVGVFIVGRNVCFPFLGAEGEIRHMPGVRSRAVGATAFEARNLPGAFLRVKVSGSERLGINLQ